MSSDSDDVQEYRHDKKRTNNPPAGLASYADEGDDENVHYNLDPHLPPQLRFDQKGKADELPDELPDLLQKAVDEGLTEDEAQTIAKALQQKQEPWLEWTNKRQKEDVEVTPTALHTHERVSAQAIVRALKREDIQHNLFADPDLPYHEAVEFYEHDVDWTNRLILGDSLEVMSSLAHREDLAGEVQMIYVDPPYGINFKSNFQPKTTSRTNRGRQKDITREPEMIKAYRDTWRLGIHSYLDYLRDRLVLCRELLDDSGSIFVQISDENLHLVRNLMDEVFGRDCFVVTFSVKKKGSQKSGLIDPVNDYVLWYGKSPRGEKKIKFNNLFEERNLESAIDDFDQVELKDGRQYPIHSLPDEDGEVRDYRMNPKQIFKDHEGARLFAKNPMTSGGQRKNQSLPFEHMGREFSPGSGNCWKTTVRTDDDSTPGMERLARAERLIPLESTWRYKKYLEDYPYKAMSNWWDGLGGTADLYVVETNPEIIQRCMLMTTDPGDLVLDPTCGSGTTAYVAEKWGRRWITTDTSRVALSLARQRILTSTYDYYKIDDEGNGQNDPGQGFAYKKAPHIMRSDIANNAAVDQVHEKYQPKLDEKLEALNEALSDTVNNDLRERLEQKLEQKREKHNRYAIVDADERRWDLPAEGETWEHWEVPFDADEEYPDLLKAALQDYREVWRAKKSEMDEVIAEGSEQEILYDDPEVVNGVTRVSGPFTVEAVRPPEQSPSNDGSPIGGTPEPTDETYDVNDSDGEGSSKNADAYLEKMTHLMDEDGIHFMDNKELEFSRLDRIEGGTYLHAEGAWKSGNGGERVAVSFGPEHGPVTGKQVEKAMREAYPRGYDEVVFAGFSFDDAAQTNIQQGESGEINFHMAHIRPDVVMEDLLYSPKKEQIFTVFGLPRTSLQTIETSEFQIEMEGVDVYDPVEGQINATEGSKVAAWFVDTDYDGRTFCICQAFFPNTPKRSPWKQFKQDLSDKIDSDKLNQLSGTTSLPFKAGEHECAAVKVIDPRGNEVMRVLDLS